MRRSRLFAPPYGLALSLTWAALVAGHAGAQPLPQHGQDKHLGVAVCGSSTCHDAAEPWLNSAVPQNESVIWSRQDKHAVAFKALQGDRARRIAGNLGIGPAQEAPLCLNCHADFPTAARRGVQFRTADGVGCEACHGGAERWLGVHVSGSASHQQNVDAGRYPTDDPVARAKLCLSCHFGDRTKFVTHRIMGAGHPRLSFELDTFTAIEPAHYRRDDDYLRRKPQAVNGAQIWAIGQAVALSEQMAMLADPKRNHDGLFPELVLLDCYACHHPLGSRQWAPRASAGLGPGVPRLNDANLVMLRVLATRVAPLLGAKLRQQGIALHRAASQGLDATAAAARDVKGTADQLVNAFAAHRFARDDMRALLRGVLDEGLQSAEYVDYVAAEQATMALGSVLAALRVIGGADRGQLEAMDRAQQALLRATSKDAEYRVEPFRQALGEFRAAAPPAATAAAEVGGTGGGAPRTPAAPARLVRR